MSPLIIFFIDHQFLNLFSAATFLVSFFSLKFFNDKAPNGLSMTVDVLLLVSIFSSASTFFLLRPLLNEIYVVTVENYALLMCSVTVNLIFASILVHSDDVISSITRIIYSTDKDVDPRVVFLLLLVLIKVTSKIYMVVIGLGMITK